MSNMAHMVRNHRRTNGIDIADVRFECIEFLLISPESYFFFFFFFFCSRGGGGGEVRGGFFFSAGRDGKPANHFSLLASRLLQAQQLALYRPLCSRKEINTCNLFNLRGAVCRRQNLLSHFDENIRLPALRSSFYKIRAGNMTTTAKFFVTNLYKRLTAICNYSSNFTGKENSRKWPIRAELLPLFGKGKS